MDAKTLMIEEYKATQEFIIHYERLIWYIGSILNASVVVLAGLAFKEGNGGQIGVVFLISVIVSFIWYQIECRFRAINLPKLRRLHELEEQLGFKQSLYVRDGDRSNPPKLSAHRLIILACILMPLAILCFWIVN